MGVLGFHPDFQLVDCRHYLLGSEPWGEAYLGGDHHLPGTLLDGQDGHDPVEPRLRGDLLAEELLDLAICRLALEERLHLER